MPKIDVDYSNTIIYKIYCKDETIKDVYVGHTTNFIQRKHLHKSACKNLNNTLKIYNVIRSNGGWDNWEMVEIAKYNCKDATEARIKEQEHYNDLKASLNSCPPYVDVSKYFCSTCNLQCCSPFQYKKHLDSNLNIPSIKSNFEYNYGYFPVIFENEVQLKRVFQKLNEENIFPRRYFYPSLNKLSYLKSLYSCPISENISSKIACLPLYFDIEKDVVLKICQIINKNL